MAIKVCLDAWHYDYYNQRPANKAYYAIANAAYFRINAYGKGEDLIITVNQEITE